VEPVDHLVAAHRQLGVALLRAQRELQGGADGEHRQLHRPVGQRAGRVDRVGQQAERRAHRGRDGRHVLDRAPSRPIDVQWWA
jgi:hypothetical protein